MTLVSVGGKLLVVDGKLAASEDCCCGCQITAAFTYAKLYNCAFQFTDTTTTEAGTGPNWWEWNFGDGTTSNLQNPSHVYSGDCTQWKVVLNVSCDGGTTIKSYAEWVICEPCENPPTLVSLATTSMGQVPLPGGGFDSNRCMYSVSAVIEVFGNRTIDDVKILADGVDRCASYSVIELADDSPKRYRVTCYGSTSSNPQTISFQVQVTDSCGCSLTATQSKTISCAPTLCSVQCPQADLPDTLIVDVAGIQDNPAFVAFTGGTTCDCGLQYDGAYEVYRTNACTWEGSYFVNATGMFCNDWLWIQVRLLADRWDVFFSIRDRSFWDIIASSRVLWAYYQKLVPPCTGVLALPLTSTASTGPFTPPNPCQLTATTCTLTV